MRILITGANGFLGQHLTLFFASQKQYEVIATGRNICKIPPQFNFAYQNIELTNKQLVTRMVEEIVPDIIIHTAAMSKPDECNIEQDKCILNNVSTTEYLVEVANKIKSKIVFVSTDFVFGENGPHAETDIPAPLNFYGKSKLMAEEFVQKNALRFAIIRPVFIYGKIWDGIRPTFLHWVKNNLEQQKRIKVVSDQLRTPTYVNDLCVGLQAMIDMDKSGIYHLAGKDIISPYDIAVTVAKVLKLDESLIVNVTSDTFVEPVTRAKKSGLKIDKAITELNYHPVSFEEGVRLSLL